MRRLAAANAMWLASAALVRLRVSAMRTKRARDERSGRMRLLQWGVPACRSIACRQWASGEEAAWRERAGEIARQRQRIAAERACDELRAQRSPQQAA